MAFKILRIEKASAASAASSAPTRARHPVFWVMRKEWLQMRRDARFRWAAAAIVILLAAATVLGWEHQRQLRVDQEAGQRAVRQQWLGQGTKNPHYAAHDGTFVFKPTSALSAFDPGVEPYTGVANFLEAHRKNEFQFRPARDNAAVARFGELTPASVLQLLVPLVIILLCFAAIAGERESGGLRQTLSQGVRPEWIGLGKILGVAGLVSLLLLPVAGMGVAALAAAPPGASGDVLARCALLVAGYALYFGIWTGISLVVSARATSSARALLTLMGIWIAVSMIVPRLAADAAQWRFPTPVALGFAEQIHQEGKAHGGHGGSREDETRREQRLLRQYHVQRVEDLPVNTMGIAMQEGEEFTSGVADRHYGELWRTFRRQDAVYQEASMFSPLLALRSLSMGMAGTDWEQDRDFASAAEQYRRRLVRIMNEDLTYHSRTGQSDYVAGEATWARLPEFHYQTPRAGWVLRRGWGNLGLLFAWCATLAVLSYQSLRRLRA